MNDLDVIDNFMTAFTRYIDSGFGLLGPDVGFLVKALIGIDVTLAGLFWAMGGEDNILGRFLRKILTVGVFAFILNSFSTLATIVFNSFEQAGLTVGGETLSAGDLLKPGRLAGTGFSAAWPLLQQASKLTSFTGFFDNFLTIAVLLFAWAIVILAFFILAVQMFVTILEFKLTSLAGFILVPFALWNRTSFLAERVLGNIVSSGVKVMVLAVIVGIGSNFFSQFTSALQGQEPDIGQAMSLVLASLALFGLGIFGPSIASGLVSGGPQLGAGAALGTAMGAAGVAALGAGAGMAGARGLGGLGAIRAGSSMGSAATGGSPGAAPPLPSMPPLPPRPPAGGGSSQITGGASTPTSSTLPPNAGAAETGPPNGPSAPAHESGSPPRSDTQGSTPDWARRLRAEQTARHHRQMTLQLLREGDHGGAGVTPNIHDKED